MIAIATKKDKTAGDIHLILVAQTLNEQRMFTRLHANVSGYVEVNVVKVHTVGGGKRNRLLFAPRLKAGSCGALELEIVKPDRSRPTVLAIK